MSTIKRKYSWIPDIGDKRDLKFMLKAPVQVPPLVDLSLQCGPLYDQGALGSCVSNAMAGAYTYTELKQGLPLFLPSRLFIYYNARRADGRVNEDCGTSLRVGVKTLVKQGVCAEASWAYNIKLFTRTPPRTCYAEALNHQALTYARVDQDENSICSCLASGFVMPFGFSVYESFESVGKDGMLPMPHSSEKMLGGHAVLATGYDLQKRLFKVRNSYGSKWGCNGHFYMPFEYLTDPDLAADLWALNTVE